LAQERHLPDAMTCRPTHPSHAAETPTLPHHFIALRTPPLQSSKRNAPLLPPIVFPETGCSKLGGVMRKADDSSGIRKSVSTPDLDGHRCRERSVHSGPEQRYCGFEQPTAADDRNIGAGSAVELHGLSRNAFLNGMQGTCKSWHATSKRWDVELENGENVRLRQHNLAILDLPKPSAEPCLRKGCNVRIKGLRHRVELNGEIGTCVQWSVSTGRWDVELLTSNMSKGLSKGQIVSLNPGNISVLAQWSNHQPLPTNAGWRGKSVSSWVFGDAQEDVYVDAPVPSRIVTVHAAYNPHIMRDSIVCTNLAGDEVALVMASFQEATLAQVKAAVATSCWCDVCDVQIVTEDGQMLNGLDSWALAEARDRT